VRGVIRFEDGKRERRFSDDEYKAFGEALLKAKGANIWPAAIAASRFLALTGWRSGEALGLRWDEVDLARRTAILRDTKTGRSMRPLPSAACDVLRNALRSDPLVFPGTRALVP
jgi:integrase